MKKLAIAAVLCGLACCAYAQEQPRLAVAPFATNVNTEKVRMDAVTIREVVESRMIASGKYVVITRDEIDKLLENQKIQASSISSKENIEKLQMQNIRYIVTGSVNAVEGGYFVAVKILDVSTGAFSHSEDRSIRAQELVDGVIALVNRFIAGMESKEGRVVQAQPGASSGGKAEAPKGGGSVAPAQPGASSGSKVYKIGNVGPAGGIVFYDKGAISDGWRYLEAVPAGTEFTDVAWGAAWIEYVAGTGTAVGSGKWNTQIIVEQLRQMRESGKAAQLCAGLNINGYKDWFLPSKDELNLMYQNLARKGLGGFSGGWYWSSSQEYTGVWFQSFSDGSQRLSGDKYDTRSVRAVRAF